MTANSPDVLGPEEVRELLGVSRQWLAELRKRPGFPEPLKLKQGPVWDGPTMRRYAAGRKGRDV